MRSFLIALLIVATSSAGLASEPGELMGPEDIVFHVEGLDAENAAGPVTDCSESDLGAFLCGAARSRFTVRELEMDAGGALYTSRMSSDEGNEILQLAQNGVVELIASFPYRRESSDGEVIDIALIDSMGIDQTNGFIYLVVNTACHRQDLTSCGFARELIRIRGLKPLAEVLKEQKRGHGRPEQPW